MSKRVDWYYHRKNCETCAKSEAMLAKLGVEADEVTDARKTRLGRAEALRLARSVGRVVVARGRQVVAFEMTDDPPNDEVLLSAILGPKGNLRAPAVRKGKTLYVGFNEEAYRGLAE